MTTALMLASTAAWAGESIVLHVQHASIVNDSAQQMALQVELTQESQGDFAAFTTRHLNETIDLKVEGAVLMSPRLMEPITGGKLMISGQFGMSELSTIAKRIEAADAKVEAAVRDAQ